MQCEIILRLEIDGQPREVNSFNVNNARADEITTMANYESQYSNFRNQFGEVIIERNRN